MRTNLELKHIKPNFMNLKKDFLISKWLLIIRVTGTAKVNNTSIIKVFNTGHKIYGD
jgi:hypothetical protein